MKRIGIILLLAMICAGCLRITEEEKAFFYAGATPQLNVRGENTIVYKKNHFQLGYNESKCSFFLTNDEGTIFYRLICNDLPSSQDQEFTASLSWNDGRKSFNKRGLRFIVKKEEEGTLWVWCRSENTGLTIKKLED